jgi:hypothetical protein
MNNQTTPSFRLRNISWLTILLAILTLLTFLEISGPSGRYVISQGGGGVMMRSFGVTTAVAPTEATPPMMNGVVFSTAVDAKGGANMMYYPGPYPTPGVSPTDTREFLKIYYNARMQTRNVGRIAQRVETTVKGYGGRIEQESVSPESSYISFAIPQSKFEAFRTELEGFVNKKFLTINISSQNLLGEKVSIEEQQKQADDTLAGYKTARETIVKNHASITKSIQSNIDSYNQEISSLKSQSQTVSVQAEIQKLSDAVLSLKQQLLNENTSYTVQLSNADNNIKYGEDYQKAVKNQDQAFLDNVATVNGTVSIQWMSLWDMAYTYLPGYWIPAIFALLTLASYKRDKRRFEIAM